MLYTLTDGKLSDAHNVLNRSIEEMFLFYYLKRIEKLNDKLTMI